MSQPQPLLDSDRSEQIGPGMRDPEIRRALRERLAEEHGEEALIVDELALCQRAVRADLCVVNGALTGYEIKSGVDTLARLPAQVAAYNAVFDYAALVADRKHIEPALEQLPAWWGVYEARRQGERLQLVRRRIGRRNPAVVPERVVELLWRDEALAVAERFGIADGCRRQTRAQLWRTLVEGLGEHELKTAVRDALRGRDSWRGQRTAEDLLPVEPWWKGLLADAQSA